MNDTVTLTLATDRILVTGELNFDSVVLSQKKGLAMIEQLRESAKPIIFDFKQITKSDSSGLAIMISWLRYAKKAGLTVSFANVPLSIVNFAASCNFEVPIWIN